MIIILYILLILAHIIAIGYFFKMKSLNLLISVIFFLLACADMIITILRWKI